MPEPIFQFAEGLRILLRSRSPEELDEGWKQQDIAPLGWDSLAAARRANLVFLEPVLKEVDGLLLRLIDRARVIADGPSVAAERVRAFRIVELERLQCATAAALVAQRFGVAGLSAVVADGAAPLSRRYYAFLGIAERHPRDEWAMFDAFLVRGGHHAFVAAAAEASRFYPERSPAQKLIDMFRAVRHDPYLRSFLGPRILQSLYVLADIDSLPFFQELLVVGHTHRDPIHCEVTRAMIMAERFTGKLQENSKFADVRSPEVKAAMDSAVDVYERHRHRFLPLALL